MEWLSGIEFFNIRLWTGPLAGRKMACLLLFLNINACLWADFYHIKSMGVGQESLLSFSVFISPLKIFHKSVWSNPDRKDT